MASWVYASLIYVNWGLLVLGRSLADMDGSIRLNDSPGVGSAPNPEFRYAGAHKSHRPYVRVGSTD
jgi:hypothetical protein